MGTLQGKVALVAGSASGIGAATARAMARAGAKIVLGDINIAGAETVAAEIGAAGGEAVACAMDIADETAVRAVVAEAVGRYGGVDVLANVAADFHPERIAQDSATDLLQLDLAIYDRTMAVNVRGFILTMKSVVPEMLKRGGGSIINLSSMSGAAPEPVRGAYAVSKGAVEALTKHVAAAYGKRGIRCNAVAPGMTTTATADPGADPFLAMMLRHHLTPYLGRYEDQAKVIVFLASDDARFITGTVIRVDGGMLTSQPSYADLTAGGSWTSPQPVAR